MGSDPSRICRPMCAALSGLTIAGSSAGSCTFSRAAAAGAIARPNMARRQRSITASCAGRVEVCGRTCSGNWPGAGDRPRPPDDRLHAYQSTPLGRRWKRGEKKQAVGRSRGGRNTKIHALADARGRLIAILLTGGEAHDCPVAERLFRRVKSPERLLGDKAYDSTEFREELASAAIKPVIPNRANRKQPFSFNKRLYKLRWRARERLQQAQGLQAHRNALRQAGPKLFRLRLPRRRPVWWL